MVDFHSLMTTFTVSSLATILITMHELAHAPPEIDCSDVHHSILEVWGSLWLCKGNPLTLHYSTPVASMHKCSWSHANTYAFGHDHWTLLCLCHQTPMLAKRLCSPNTCTHWMLFRLNAYAPLAAIMPFCTSSDLSHYFQTLCISLFTVYIRPCQQRDPYSFLFGFPASPLLIVFTLQSPLQ